MGTYESCFCVKELFTNKNEKGPLLVGQGFGGWVLSDVVPLVVVNPTYQETTPRRDM